jgi:hypothetical protein
MFHNTSISMAFSDASIVSPYFALLWFERSRLTRDAEDNKPTFSANLSDRTYSQQSRKTGCSPESLAPLKTPHKIRTFGLICPFLPPRIFVKSQPIKKMVDRGGGFEPTTFHAMEARSQLRHRPTIEDK